MRLLIAILLVFQGLAFAEWNVSGYIGGAHTQTSNLRIDQPGANTNLVFRGVSWSGQSFTSPLYYGVRGGDFIARHLGVEVEFIHMKVFALTDRAIPVQGTLRGSTLNTAARMNTIVQRFSISHGNNLLLGNLVLRKDFWHGTSESIGRLLLAARVGVGGTIPHAESTVLGSADEHYQRGSPAEQVAAGAEFRLVRHLYALGEYKYTHNHQHVLIVGGTADSSLNSHHIVTGLALHF